MRWAPVWVVVWVTAALGWAEAPAGPKPAPQRQDERIEAAIRARFAKSKIAQNNFRVRVEKGVATLEGRTDVIQHKGTATRLAKSAGAVRVVNRIEVSQAARNRAARRGSRTRPRAQVKRRAETARGESRAAR